MLALWHVLYLAAWSSQQHMVLVCCTACLQQTIPTCREQHGRHIRIWPSFSTALDFHVLQTSHRQLVEATNAGLGL